MRRLLLIGGGGHCRSIVDSIISMNLYDEIGIIDNNDSSMSEVPVIGTDDDIEALYKKGWNEAFISVGSVGDVRIRKKLYEMVKSYGISIATIIDPTAIVANNCEIKEGVYIGKKAVVNTNSLVKECAILNTGSIIEHDCVVGSFSHISPGTTICGNVSIGDETHIGAGTVVIQGISVGSQSIVGAGSVVVKDIPTKVKAYGNPCKVVQ